MIKTGLDIISEDFPEKLKGKKIGLLCHAASITGNFRHIRDIISERKDCSLAAIFGPQHGLYGQTQDNMIEWDGHSDPYLRIPVYSLYGESRKPTPEMLSDVDILLIDLQDVGARLYTYIWTIKLCLEACSELGIPVMLLDRPNPVSKLPLDGPVLKEEYFTFVGGACIPLCHRMTIGEIAYWLKVKYYNKCDLTIMWMREWHRNTLFSETGLPWVLPSPNMPTLQTAMVYPGMVLAEALNLSEGRGTTIPFELFGAPFINPVKLKNNLDNRKIPGCAFRIHNFIPTFNKFSNVYCNGIQIHITKTEIFYPVRTAIEIFDAIIETSAEGSLVFNKPPYEYEYELMPFDILSGDEAMRITLEQRNPVENEIERWKYETEIFREEFKQFSAYPE